MFLKNYATLSAFIILLGLVLIQPAAADTVTREWVALYSAGYHYHDEAALAVDTEGNVYLAGYFNDNDNRNYLTIKYDSQGNELWDVIYDGAAGGWDVAQGITVDSSGNVYVTGFSYVATSDTDCVTIKYDSDGTEQWIRNYAGPAGNKEYGENIALDATGNIYVTLAAYNSLGSPDVAMIKYDPDGNVVWTNIYNGPGSGWDEAAAIVVDASGNPYVTGYASNGDNTDYLTIKYDAANGTAIWTRIYNGAGDYPDKAVDIALDNAGHVYVTGYSYKSGSTMDIVTIKYDAIDGGEVWTSIYDGPTGKDDRAYGIAVDSFGNAYVTGSYKNGYNWDCLTIKHDATDGSVVWERFYEGYYARDDKFSDVAVDAAGNAYVTGSLTVLNIITDYLTIKYDPDGNVVWTETYDGPEDYTDFAHAIAVDARNNVYVTGYVRDQERNDRYGTIKYSQKKSCPAGYICLQTRMHGLFDGVEHTCETQVAVRLFGTVTYDIASATVGQDGWVELFAANPFIPLPPGNYYVVLTHLNHIDLITAAPIAWDGSTSVTVDFTDPANVECGETTMYEYSTGVWAMPAGDIDPDDRVALSDFNYLRTHWTEVDPACDLDCDGFCRLGDFNKLRQTWNTQGCAP